MVDYTKKIERNSMSKQYELLVDNIVIRDGVVFLVLDENILAFDGSQIEYWESKTKTVYYHFNTFLPDVNGSTVLMSEELVEMFDLYDYCDYVDPLDYENLEFTALDFDIEQLFD
jgi:hypothetical protein